MATSTTTTTPPSFHPKYILSPYNKRKSIIAIPTQKHFSIPFIEFNRWTSDQRSKNKFSLKRTKTLQKVCINKGFQLSNRSSTPDWQASNMELMAVRWWLLNKQGIKIKLKLQIQFCQWASGPTQRQMKSNSIRISNSGGEKVNLKPLKSSSEGLILLNINKIQPLSLALKTN